MEVHDYNPFRQTRLVQLRIQGQWNQWFSDGFVPKQMLSSPGKTTNVLPPPPGQIPEYTSGLIGSKVWKKQDKKVKYDWCAMYVCIGLVCVKYDWCTTCLY